MNLSACSVVRLHQLDVLHSQRLRQLVQSDHGWIAPPAFEAAEILLAEARTFFHLLLRQALFPTQAGKVPADQFAHIHAQTVRGLHTLSLSTIVCKMQSSIILMKLFVIGLFLSRPGSAPVDAPA
jgi:hypothetical protein